MNFKFPKSAVLSSEKEIGELFGSQHKFVVFPFKVQWIKNNKSNHQVLMSCPKRKFKRAVDRNLIKRRMREAYRLNKSVLDEENETNSHYFNIAFVYIGNEIMDSSVIHSKLVIALDKLKEDWNKNE